MEITIIKKNAYYDSVTLMSLSSKVLAMEGVTEAVISMATPMNKELLEKVGLSTKEAQDAGGNDLIIAIRADHQGALEAAEKKVDELLNTRKKGRDKGEAPSPKTIAGALKTMEGANLAVISVPGQYAAREAKIALENGLHVMMFSDNVTLEEERRLKELARERGLLMMGPDCGTAAINQTGLCFANQVRKGGIGIVAASGTGLQEVMVQIHRLGGGISQAIGTGGRDLKEEIGGIMMLQGLKALDQDPETQVIVLISKPPAPSVEERILEQVKSLQKPVVLCFLEGDPEGIAADNLIFAYNMYDTAEKAVRASGHELNSEAESQRRAQVEVFIQRAKGNLKPQQKYVRGLFGGGTLCAEALTILRKELGSIKSNISKRPQEALADLDSYTGNVLLDLGEDEFTLGKPHPMIEPALRLDRIKQEAKDETVGVILLDFELGFGSHETPVGVTLDTIKEAKALASQEGRSIIFIAYLCGTELDKQGYRSQLELLETEGVLVAQSNVEAAYMAARILQ